MAASVMSSDVEISLTIKREKGHKEERDFSTPLRSARNDKRNVCFRENLIEGSMISHYDIIYADDCGFTAGTGKKTSVALSSGKNFPCGGGAARRRATTARNFYPGSATLLWGVQNAWKRLAPYRKASSGMGGAELKTFAY
jgi:hypothetical protein